MRNSLLSGLGLALLLAGIVIGIFPLLPATPAVGLPMQGVPHWQAWEWGGLMGLGVVLLIWARQRSSASC